MRALVKNCLHGSNIYLVEETDASGVVKAIIKSSSTPEGIKDLCRELEGISWYNLRTAQHIKVDKNHKTPFYLSLKFEFIEGEIYSYNRGYEPNKKAIASILDHYCSIWGHEATGRTEHPLHGDLSLENVIFANKGPVIIDWEHFNLAGAPLGFDALYLLFETLWYESMNKKIGMNSLEHVSQMIQFLRSKRCLDMRFSSGPLRETINFIKNNDLLWGNQIPSGKLLPILLFEEKNIIIIDELLCARSF